jgi:hypothetical protein
MTLEALQHLLRSARALAEDRELLVMGSASLLVSYPDWIGESSPLAATFDAYLLAEPFDELTGVMLEEALGEDRAYFRRHGYHIDVLRDSIVTTLPEGWRERLVPVPGCPYARALDPADLAAVKLWVGRPKDLNLVRVLVDRGCLNGATVLERIALLPVELEARPRILARYREAFG